MQTDTETPTRAATTKALAQINRPFSPHATDTDTFDALNETLRHDLSCEDLLFTQADLLDALFKRIVFRDMHTPYKFEDGTPRLDEDKLVLALKSQRAARNTIEALSIVRARKSKNAKTK